MHDTQNFDSPRLRPPSCYPSGGGLSKGGESRMELHDLRSFVAVYQAGSITRAAACAHITRQAMSKSLEHLEAELGPLFERRHEGVSPTT